MAFSRCNVADKGFDVSHGLLRFITLINEL